MESLSPKIQDLIKNEAQKQNFKNYEVKVTGGSKKGDGYLSEVRAIQITETNLNKSLNFILKVASTNTEFRKMFPIRNAFLREIYVYERVMPKIFEFQEKYTSNGFNKIAKYYGSVREELKEAILLENLTLDGYRVANRKEPMDDDHLKMILTEYAKFHAISLAMKTLETKKFENLMETITDPFGENDYNNIKQMESFFRDTLNVVKDNPKAENAVRKLMKELLQIMSKNVKEEEKHLVICHSDCWAPNYMFKYEDQEIPQKPTTLCIIDWQLSTISLVISDISYFLLMSGSKKAFQHHKEYLKVYYETLRTRLEEFGCNVDKVYCWEDFENHWKKYAKIGFFRTVIMLRQALTDQGTDKLETTIDEGKDGFHREFDNIDLFNTRMADIVNFLVDNDFL